MHAMGAMQAGLRWLVLGAMPARPVQRCGYLRPSYNALMPGWLAITLLIVLIIVNAGGVVLVLLQLPGTWLIFASTMLVWLFLDEYFSVWTVAALAVLAAVGELVEGLASAFGAKKRGASKRAIVMSIAGAVAGAIAGTVLIPIPIVGTIAGACAGSALGSMTGDRWAGKAWHETIDAGKGAAVGRLWGTIGKVAVAVVMWLVVTVAVIAP